MAKKLLASLLSLCLLCGMLGACSKAAPQEPAATPTAAPTTAPTEPNPLDDPNHPANDDTLSILMVGNSFCYYYVEELYGLLAANPDPNRGYEKVRVLNLYYSGCRLDQHLTWWQGGLANYQLFQTDENGRVEMEPVKQWTLENALRQGNWDYISLQGSVKGMSYSTPDLTETKTAIANTATPLLDFIHGEHPYAQLLWHRTWPYEVGRISGSTTYDADLLERYNAGMQAVCDYMTNEFDQDKDYDLIQVNSGAAWVEARLQNAKLETSLIPVEGGLCARLNVRNESTFPYFMTNSSAGDGYHEGDIGGGQFLNACVWYETITGQSCLDNPYQPTKDNGKYELSNEFVALLRNAAHSVNAK